jgi:uncharacterized protein
VHSEPTSPATFASPPPAPQGYAEQPFGTPSSLHVQPPLAVAPLQVGAPTGAFPEGLASPQAAHQQPYAPYPEAETFGQPFAPQQYTQQPPAAPQQYTPQQAMPYSGGEPNGQFAAGQQHAPQQMTPQPHGQQQQYAPQQMAPQSTAPQTAAPQQMAPQAAIPQAYAPVADAPQHHAPAPAAPQYAPQPPAFDDAPAPIPMKIVISGGFGVGKTTFVGTISDIPPLTTEAAMTGMAVGVDDRGQVSTKTTTTVAMDFGRVAVDRSLVLYLFGTPGQDRFGFMWDDLVTGALGAIVLVDTRRLDDCFPAIDYFEDRQIPFVVVLNRFDGDLVHSVDSVRAALQLDPDVPIVTTDARNRQNVKESVLALLDVVLSRAIARSGNVF